MSTRDKAMGHYQQAQALRKQGRALDAAKQASIAISVDPQPQFYVERSWAYFQAGEAEKAYGDLARMQALVSGGGNGGFNPDEVAALTKQVEQSLQEKNSRMLMIEQACNEKNIDALIIASGLSDQ